MSAASRWRTRRPASRSRSTPPTARPGASYLQAVGNAHARSGCAMFRRKRIDAISLQTDQDYVPALRTFFRTRERRLANPMMLAAILRRALAAAPAAPAPEIATSRRRSTCSRIRRGWSLTAVAARAWSLLGVPRVAGACDSLAASRTAPPPPDAARRRACASWSSCARRCARARAATPSASPSRMCSAAIIGAQFRPARARSRPRPSFSRRSRKAPRFHRRRPRACSREFLERCDLIKFARIDATCGRQRSSCSRARWPLCRAGPRGNGRISFA